MLPPVLRELFVDKYSELWKYVGEQAENALSLTYDDIQRIAGVPMDHSFLTYKKALLEYGWCVKKIHMKDRVVDFARTES